MRIKSAIREITLGKVFLAIIFLAGIVATIQRFFFGLGSATNLSDAFPWGIWIGFDVLCGVGLAAGGFVIAGIVYIFNVKSFQPVVKPAVLTAFLGYLLVIVALLYDLGKPYNIWHPLIMWNPHSVMFEVGWCVMCYTTVLFLEFLPNIFQKLKFDKGYRILKQVTVILVIFGVLFSTLHQSSLGSLFLIVPEKLHPLWYSPLLPVYFFISAVAVGFAMVLFESYLSSRSFGKHLTPKLSSTLARCIVFVLSLYLVIKMIDFNRHQLWGELFTGSTESYFFWTEIGLGVIAPILLLSRKAIRTNETTLFWSTILVILGFIFNRLNVSITAMEAYAKVNYFPSWQEISVSIFLVTLGFLAFKWVAKNLPIFEEEHHLPVLNETIPVEILVDSKK
ncbi:MAG: Ni/Fe-hydrogenase cytochrome b subunit [Calditrichia bacterium]